MLIRISILTSASMQDVRGVLGLFQELGETRSTVQKISGRGITAKPYRPPNPAKESSYSQVGTKLSESGDFAVLGKVQLERTSDRLHELGLSSRLEKQTLSGIRESSGHGQHLQPTLMAGRTPLKKSSDSKKICPSS